jgi:hypothetical protein
MKKSTLFLLTFSLFLFFNNRTSAQEINTPMQDFSKKEITQSPYKVSVGGMIHILAAGPSVKIVCKKIAFQTDMFFKLLFTEGDACWGNLAIYGSFAINENIIYQKKIKTKKSFDTFLLAGGGASFGITPIQLNRKLGTNVIIGMEFVFNFPLAIQIDVRPGYGLLYNPSGELNSSGVLFTLNPYPLYSPWHHFDWSFGVTVRKVFKKKQ